MSEAEATEKNDPLKAVADAMEAAVEAAKEGAAEASETIATAMPVAATMMAKLAYNTCYGISYGVVFPSILLARSVPQDNAIVHGLVDGARAAMDMVDEMKTKTQSLPAETDPALADHGEVHSAPPGA